VTQENTNTLSGQNTPAYSGIVSLTQENTNTLSGRTLQLILEWRQRHKKIQTHYQGKTLQLILEHQQWQKYSMETSMVPGTNTLDYSRIISFKEKKL
jgi:hypothetical protein